MEYEGASEERLGIYIDPTTGKVILQIGQFTTINFKNLAEVANLADCLDQLLANIMESHRQIGETDATLAVEEFERIVIETSAENPGVDRMGVGRHDRSHRTACSSSESLPPIVQTGAQRPETDYSAVERYWKVTLMGMTGRSKTRLVKAIRDLGYPNLAASRQQVETAPSVIFITITKPDADHIKKQLERAGGIVDVDFGAGVSEQDPTRFGWELHILKASTKDTRRMVTTLTDACYISSEDAAALFGSLPRILGIRGTMKSAAELKESLDACGVDTMLTPPTGVFRIEHFFPLRESEGSD